MTSDWIALPGAQAVNVHAIDFLEIRDRTDIVLWLRCGREVIFSMTLEPGRHLFMELAGRGLLPKGKDETP